MRPEAAARLAELRGRIDALDEAVVALVAERAAVVDQIAALKAAEGVELRDPGREQQIVDRLVAARPPRLAPAGVEGLARAVLRACRPPAG